MASTLSEGEGGSPPRALSRGGTEPGLEQHPSGWCGKRLRRIGRLWRPEVLVTWLGDSIRDRAGEERGDSRWVAGLRMYLEGRASRIC